MFKKHGDGSIFYLLKGLLKNRTVPFILLLIIAGVFFRERQEVLAWNKLKEKISGQVEIFGQDTAVVVKDLWTGRKIAINEDRLFPSASMVKIPIMASLIYTQAQGRIDLAKKLTLRNRDKVLGSGMLKSYPSGTEISLDELIELMISQSDNTAANMLIDYLGFDYLNVSFKEIGLTSTNIVRPMMDFKKRREGIENFTSARDLVYLLERIYKGHLINDECSKKCLEILKRQKVKDRIPANLPPNTVVANKTGLENGVCHDAGIVWTQKGDFIICVLTKHSYKTSHPAKQLISQIALDTYNFYNSPP